MTSSDVLTVSEIAEVTSEVLTWLSDSVNETAGSSTTSDSETTVLIEFSDSDAEVSEVDDSEIISVSETFDNTVVLSDTSDEAAESAVLVASEAGVVIESDATAPWSVLDAELSSFLSCAVSDTAIATGTAAGFTNSSTVGAGLVISSSLGASTDGFVSVGASEPLFTVVFSDLAVSELASDVTVLSTFLPAWLVTGFKITGSTGVAVVSSLI